MGNRLNAVDQAGHVGRRTLRELGDELREARLRAGLRQSDVARAVGVSQAWISVIELGRKDAIRFLDLTRIAGAVGLKLYARMYPAGPALRDQAQLALLARLRRRLPPKAQLRLEVPIGADTRDQRAWDMVVRLPGPDGMAGITVGVEAITRLRDVQAQVRAAQLKRHDAAAERLVLLVAATRANRRALAEARPVIDPAFTIGTRAALASLSGGRDPGGDALIVL